MKTPASFLIVQTAFTGDVILATALVEKLSGEFPDASIDFLLRKGNEGLLQGHPRLRTVLIWDKKRRKIRNLFKILRTIRSNHYDIVINVHRFASSGFITAFSGASETVGFDKNPLSFLFTRKIHHVIHSGTHEVGRNQMLIASLTGVSPSKPRLYPLAGDLEAVAPYAKGMFICVAPTSVWFTKQFPPPKWIEFLDRLAGTGLNVYLLGAPADAPLAEAILQATSNRNITNLAGKLNFLQSAALMRGARMNYVNDSAPMHMASSVNAPVTAVYCSTIPGFGFGPLSDQSFIIETKENLDCRPCGLHGYKACPLGHFRCATTIDPGAFPIPGGSAAPSR